MEWEKLGLVFCPRQQFDWMQTHASNPVAEVLENDHIRVFFSCRDAKKRSFVGSLVFSLNNPQKIRDLSPTPVLSPGELGIYDDSGVSLGCLVKKGTTRYLYYMGWNLSVTVPWRNSIGLAVSKDPVSPFVKVSRAPIVDRSDGDPFSLSYPYVLPTPTGWRMWYGSHLQWGSEISDMNHVIKYAESEDGIHWRRSGKIAIAIDFPKEIGASRPSVVFDNGTYKMWYSVRRKSYEIGYAESNDGKEWVRKDSEAGLVPSSSGWDSEMICYPYIFDHKSERYALYCGNEYGKTGFGLARLKSR